MVEVPSPVPAVANPLIPRLQAAIRRAQADNLVDNPVYSGSATLAQATVVSGATTLSVSPNAPSVTWTKGKVIGTSSVVNYTITTANKTVNQIMLSAGEFKTDSPTVSIKIKRQSGVSFRAAINNRYISKTPTTLITTDPTFTWLVFSGLTAGDKIRLELALPTGQFTGYPQVEGLFVEPVRTVWADPVRVRALVVGDSFTQGTGATWQHDTFAAVMGELLGWDDTWPAGQSGTGYTADLSGNGYTPLQRLAADIALMPSVPDVIAFPLGFNDNASDSAYDTAVSNTFKLARSLAPKALIMSVGVWHGPNNGPLDANYVSTFSKNAETHISGVIAALADPMTNFVPQVTNPSGAPVYGSGKSTATTGTGNTDIYTGSDGTHPTAVGHTYLGRRIADAVRSAILAL